MIINDCNITVICKTNKDAVSLDFCKKECGWFIEFRDSQVYCEAPVRTKVKVLHFCPDCDWNVMPFYRQSKPFRCPRCGIMLTWPPRKTVEI